MFKPIWGCSTTIITSYYAYFTLEYFCSFSLFWGLWSDYITAPAGSKSFYESICNVNSIMVTIIYRKNDMTLTNFVYQRVQS